MRGPIDEGLFADLALRGDWRGYQQTVLEACERAWAAGTTAVHVVAPAGSGLTLIGLELVRRSGAPTLVITPDPLGAERWTRAAARFTDRATVGGHPGSPVTVLTHRALCRSSEPRELLQRTLALPQRQPAADGDDAGASDRTADAPALAALMDAIASARSQDEVPARELPGETEDLIARLRAEGIGTIVLDRCEDLASDWGFALRLICARIAPDARIVGLGTGTGTGGEPTGAQRTLHRNLLGPVTVWVPAAALAAEGHLNPFQELVWFCEPLPHELHRLGRRDGGLRALTLALRRDDPGPLDFRRWTSDLFRPPSDGLGTPEPGEDPNDGAPRRAGGPGPETDAPTWDDLARRAPRVARAAVRFLRWAGEPPPRGAPGGEGYREEPTLEDWLALLRTHAAHRLRPDRSTPAREREDAIGRALADMGLSLTDGGIRGSAREGERLLRHSGAKLTGLCEIVAHEGAARAQTLRGLVVCPQERPAPDEERPPGTRSVTAQDTLLALAEDDRTRAVVAVLLASDGLRCAARHAEWVIGSLRERAPSQLSGWRAVPDGDGLMRLEADGDRWTPRTWIRLATDAFGAGRIQVVVTTPRSPGDDWSDQCVNCLVDLGCADDPTLTARLRRSSLERDPDQPPTVVSHWSVVCVAPGHPEGGADHARFVDAHAEVVAPADDGVLEAGLGHIPPALSPAAPPPRGLLTSITARCLARADDPDAALERWASVGRFDNRARDSIVIAGPSEDAPGVTERESPQPLPDRRLAALRALARLNPYPDGELDPVRAAHAIGEALVRVGDISVGAGRSLTVTTRDDGHRRAFLARGDRAECAAFAAAMDALLAPAGGPLWWLACPFPGRRSPTIGWARALTGRAAYDLRWLAIPPPFADDPRRRTTFTAAWSRWFGPAVGGHTPMTIPPGRPLIARSPTAGTRTAARRPTLS
ncbi:MAG TPA: hypothetical protein PKE32_04110 [Miltoncostaeaceae bacterium]|nr:hypothetical protein [Miltoncostaeaceae bacterium]